MENSTGGEGATDGEGALGEAVGVGNPVVGVPLQKDHETLNRLANVGRSSCPGGSGCKFGDCWSLEGVLEDRRKK